MTEKVSKRQKIFVQTIMYNGKLDKNYSSIRVRLNKHLKSKSLIQLPPDPDSLVELKCVHLHCYAWLNALKTTLP